MIRKIKTILREQITRGTSAKSLALTFAMTSSLAVFPVLGSTTFLCLLFGSVFKLNHPLMQTLNYGLYPLQILMIPVFLKIGEAVLGLPHVPLNPTELMELFTSDPMTFVRQYGMAALHAILGWTLASTLLSSIIYFIVYALLSNLPKRRV